MSEMSVFTADTPSHTSETSPARRPEQQQRQQLRKPSSYVRRIANLQIHDDNSVCDTTTSSEVYTEHKSRFNTVIAHLSHPNPTENRIGLARLLDTIEIEGRPWFDCPPSVSDAAFAVIYGGEYDAEELQRLIGSFIHTNTKQEQQQPRQEGEEERRQGSRKKTQMARKAATDDEGDYDNHEDDTYDDEDVQSSYSLPVKWKVAKKNNGERDDDISQWSTQPANYDDYSRLRKNNPVRAGLEVQALRVVSKSLQQVLLAEDDDDDDDDNDNDTNSVTVMKIRRRRRTTTQHLDFDGPFWMGMITSLIHNLRNFDSKEMDVLEQSMTILRLLHTLHPQMVTSLLDYVLFPYLSEIIQYAQDEDLETIELEADRLLHYERSHCYGFEI